MYFISNDAKLFQPKTRESMYFTLLILPTRTFAYKCFFPIRQMAMNRIKLAVELPHVVCSGPNQYSLSKAARVEITWSPVDVTWTTGPGLRFYGLCLAFELLMYIYIYIYMERERDKQREWERVRVTVSEREREGERRGREKKRAFSSIECEYIIPYVLICQPSTYFDVRCTLYQL